MADTRGDALMAEAEKKLNSFSWFGGGSKTEEAAEIYTKAGNAYKVAKKWEQAGLAFSKAADCQLKLKNTYEAATALVNAGNVYKKSSAGDAVACLEQAVQYYAEEGRFNMAARYQKEVAELLEADSMMEDAANAYQTAADYFEGEGSVSSANTCLLKVADLSAGLENYDKAAELFEAVASNSLGNRLLQYSVPEYFMKASLCTLASGDVVKARRNLERYQSLDPNFARGRECRFLLDVLQALEQLDLDAFMKALVEYDSVSRVDNWKSSLLLKVKNTLKNEGDSLT
eukprot:CAMPEP_0177649518 /NCGR_PEP_ID=MMETSP0447-20121125/11438_1 /TAXON_ID=0 /ORGANISM="Stygamoeba regulata, Strain BSH-02190019" /LENGTH=286 /DNA_ID=CAMNT_0019152299 /DNA_START=59 /DNA_END=919 /DNA_ORIENTATION=-